MSASVVPEATLVLDIPRRGATAALLSAAPTIAAALAHAMERLLA